jgi:hypothetical protein
MARRRRPHPLALAVTQPLDTVEDVDALPTPAVQAAEGATIAALDEQLVRGGSPPRANRGEGRR